jgi:hypothetical protein
MSCDPRELLILCETILEDGELTHDELYKMAEWLNNHREACFHWPGNLLVAPLQKAWADGKITKTEARQLARVILDICKEAAKREAEETFVRAAETASEAAHTFDLTTATLPTVPFSTRVKSYTKRGAFYEVISAVRPAPAQISLIPSQAQRKAADTLLQACLRCLRSA